MATDLKDDATKQEIQAFVDQAVADIQEDRKGDEPEEKTDSQRVAEEHDEPVTEREPAETDSGSDDDTADKGEKTGDSEDQADDWLDDDLKAEATAYGIDEKELAEFTSREELDRALRFFDRAALEAGRKALAEGEKDESKTRDGQGRFVKTEPEPKPESEPKEGRYEIKLDKDAYDEDLIGELTRLRDHYESRMDALETRFIESDAKEQEARFDAAVDAVGRADLFGKTGHETPAQLKRRQELLPRVEGQQYGLERVGVQLDYAKIVEQTARGVFAEDFLKKALKARTRKLSKQSDGRMGGGGAKSPGAAETLEEEMDRIYKEMENA